MTLVEHNNHRPSNNARHNGRPCHVELQLRNSGRDNKSQQTNNSSTTEHFDSSSIDMQFTHVAEEDLEREIRQQTSSTKSAAAALSTPRRDTTTIATANELLVLTQSSSIGNENNADDVSVGSVIYFEPTDFNPTNWKMALDAPTVGLAVVALTIATAHPLLFVAGALTAFGTARALNTPFDFWTDNNPLLAWCTKYNRADDAVTDEPYDKSTKDQETVAGDTTDAESAVGIEDGSNNNNNNNNNDVNRVLITTDTGTLPQVDTCPSAPILYQRDSTQQTPVNASLDDPIVEEDLAAFYPDLENHVVDQVKIVGLNVAQIFAVFFSDTAPYNFQEFQKLRGDTNIVYMPWKNLNVNDITVSMHTNATKKFPIEKRFRSWQGRTQHFNAKTNSYFGPPYATTTKTQRIWIPSKKLAILESRTDLKDIPFCERFFVMERWVFTAVKDESKRYISSGRASCQVFFSKSCPFESQIRTKSAITVAEVSKAWCKMATEAMKLTEIAKENRLRQENDDEETDWCDDTQEPTDHHSQTENKQPADHESYSNTDVDIEKDGIEVDHNSHILTSRQNEQQLLPSVIRVHSEPVATTPKRSFKSFGRSFSNMMRQSRKPTEHLE